MTNNEVKKKTKKKTTKKIKKTIKKESNIKSNSKIQPKSELESLQPLINIGLVGHVDHGKTTLTEKLTGKWTDTHSEEQKRGITIRLGYANTLIRFCESSKSYTIADTCDGKPTHPTLKISFVDAPGHESLMATMLSGAAIMDAALLLIAANEKCPQPQTKEHLMAMDVMGIKKIIVLQNKIDLLSKDEIIKNYKEIKSFLKNTPYENSPIVPISAKYGINTNQVLKLIVNYFDIPSRELNVKPLMFVARSFDINKPGSPIEKLKGGILGGTIKQGVLKIGDEIEILPGFSEEKDGKRTRIPIFTKIIGLKTDKENLKQAIPGGSIAMQTTLDPAISKSDQLAGNVIGLKGELPPVRNTLKLKVTMFKTIIGNDNQDVSVDNFKLKELVMINVNAAATVGIISNIKKDLVEFSLKIPVCASKDTRVSLSRRIGSRFRLVGFGMIID